MKNLNNMEAIMFTGLTVNDLLYRIEQIIDAKLSFPSVPKENQSAGYLSRKEVAKLLRIALPTLHDYTKQGRLKAYKIGSRVLYKEVEVKAALEGIATLKHKKEVRYV